MRPKGTAITAQTPSASGRNGTLARAERNGTLARAGRNGTLVRGGQFVAAGTAGILAAHLVPSVGTIPAVHQRLGDRLSGRSGLPHVALTFDDGPDPRSTPLFLAELARLQVQATFFLLGSQLIRHPELGRRIVAAGHEIGVHGWAHRPHLLRSPWRVASDIARARDYLAEVTGMTPTFWRPPNGILSGGGLLAAGACGLRPVLWTADGRDWEASATPESVRTRVDSRLAAGGTVLLHDADLMTAPEAWRSSLAALPELVDACRQRGWTVGPLRDHWQPAGPALGSTSGY